MIENLGSLLYSGTKSDRKSDSLGSSADGTNTGITKIGKIGAGQASFDGNDKASVTGQTIALSNDGWAVSGWFYSTTAGSLQMITFLPTSGSDIYLYKNTDNTIKTEGLGGTISSSAISTNQWYHFVINYDHSSTTTTLYLDGTSAGTATGAQAVNITSIEIGAEGTSYYWNGKMDDIAVFSRKLTSAEITSLSGGDATSTISATNLQALYTFDSNFNDSSTNSRNLTNSGITLETAKLGTGCYSFDGSNDYVECGTTSDWKFLHDGSKSTIAFWAKLDDTSQGDPAGIICTSNINNSSTGTAVFISNGDEICYLTNNGSTSTQNSQNIFTIPDTDWHHYTFTYDGSLANTNLVFYFDGVQKATGNKQNTFATGNSTNPLRIGRGNSVYFGGELDDIGIYKRVLTATEIETLSGLSGKSTATATSTSRALGGGSPMMTKVGFEVATGHPLVGTNLKAISFTMDKYVASGSVGGDGYCAVYNSSGTQKGSNSTTKGWNDLTHNTKEVVTFTFPSAIAIANGDRIVIEGGTYTANAQVDLYYQNSDVDANSGAVSFSSSGWSGVTTTTDIWYRAYATGGALVSSLTNRSEGKAYYSMDSTSLESLKGTADYTEVFASDLPTGWSEDYASGYDGNFRGNYDGSSTTNALWVDFNDGTSYNIRGWIDLKTSKSIDVSDTKWTLRYTLNVDNFSTGGQILMGMSTNDDKYNENQRFLGVRIKDGDDIRLMSTDDRSDLASGNDTPSAGYDMDEDTNYFVEIYRNSSTLGLRIRTGSHSGILVHDVSQTIDDSGADHVAMDFIKFMNKNSSGSGEGIKAIFKDLKFYNNSASADGCKNDFSATSDLEALTGVRTNSIFTQTDDVPAYYWYQTLDGVTAWFPTLQDTFPNDDNWTVGTTTMGISGNALNYDNDHTLSTNTNAISYRAITAVNDSKWTMTFTLTIEDYNAGGNDGQNTMYVGLASVVTSPTANTDFLGLAISGNNNPKFVVIQRDGGQVADAPTPTGQQFSRTPTEETLYVKMVRDGSNFTVSLYSDSTFETLLESQTQTISGTISDLDNINMITMHGGTSGTPSNDGKIEDVKIYNGVSSI